MVLPINSPKSNKPLLSRMETSSSFVFDDGLKAYLFQLAVFNDFDKRYGLKEIPDYVSKACTCVRNDSNDTPIADFAEFLVNRWRIAKSMDSYDLLQYFYDYHN